MILIDILSLLVQVVMGIALFNFILGLAIFIGKAGDEKGRAEGKLVMKWGIIALFIMVSIWGILRFLQGELEFQDVGIPQLFTNP